MKFQKIRSVPCFLLVTCCLFACKSSKQTQLLPTLPTPADQSSPEQGDVEGRKTDQNQPVIEVAEKFESFLFQRLNQHWTFDVPRSETALEEPVNEKSLKVLPSSLAKSIFKKVSSANLSASQIEKDFLSPRYTHINSLLRHPAELELAYQKLIASAQHEVILSARVWRGSSKGLVEAIRLGLIQAQKGLKPTHKLEVKILVEEVGLGKVLNKYPSIDEVNRSIRRWIDSKSVDIRKVSFKIATARSSFRKSMMIRALIVDGRRAVLSSSDIYGGTNHKNSVSTHLAISFEGPVVLALLNNFDSRWKSKVSFWRCKDECRKATSIPSDGPRNWLYQGIVVDQWKIPTPVIPSILLTHQNGQNLNDEKSSTRSMAIKELLTKVQTRLFIESQSIASSEFISLLAKAAARGVKIRLLLSYKVPAEYGVTSVFWGRRSNLDSVQDLISRVRKIKTDLTEDALKELIQVRWFSQDGQNYKDLKNGALLLGNQMIVDGSTLVVSTTPFSADSFAKAVGAALMVDSQELVRDYESKKLPLNWKYSVVFNEY